MSHGKQKELSIFQLVREHLIFSFVTVIALTLVSIVITYIYTNLPEGAQENIKSAGTVLQNSFISFYDWINSEKTTQAVDKLVLKIDTFFFHVFQVVIGLYIATLFACTALIIPNIYLKNIDKTARENIFTKMVTTYVYVGIICASGYVGYYTSTSNTVKTVVGFIINP